MRNHYHSDSSSRLKHKKTAIQWKLPVSSLSLNLMFRAIMCKVIVSRHHYHVIIYHLPQYHHGVKNKWTKENGTATTKETTTASRNNTGIISVAKFTVKLLFQQHYNSVKSSLRQSEEKTHKHHSNWSLPGAWTRDNSDCWVTVQMRSW